MVDGGKCDEEYRGAGKGLVDDLQGFFPGSDPVWERNMGGALRKAPQA